MSKETRTDKLGEVSKQPGKSKFQILRRMPGWHADTQADGMVTLFPEEMLRRTSGSNGKFEHFPVPGEKIGKSEAKDSRQMEKFTEPPPLDRSKPETAVAWCDFNQWFLGTPLVDDPKKKDKFFFDFLNEIANHVRRYNAALYWMRRLHYLENVTGTQPPRNPHGDKEPATGMPDPGTLEFDALITQAQYEWDKVVEDLNALLNGEKKTSNHGFTDTKADMVEVNGYIVSMRIVSQKRPWLKEIGGSSSSHFSVSSAFFSSSSSGKPKRVSKKS